MSKQIHAQELAEIVTGLLIKPDLLGELDCPERHYAFMRDIARVVAEHCGGTIDEVDQAGSGLQGPRGLPYLRVSPNDALPSLLGNVWSHHDPDGWKEGDADCCGVELGDQPSPDTSSVVRKQLQGLLSNAGLSRGEFQVLHYQMVDWRLHDDEDVEQCGDERPYLVAASIGNESRLNFTDQHGEPCVGVMIEINHGVPAVHIDINGGDSVLHIHAVDGGLVLTPDDPSARFEPASMSRYSYNDKASLFIR